MRLFPQQYQQLVSGEDAERVNLAMLALRMKRFQHELKAQPAQDIWDIAAVMNDEAQRR